MSAAAGLLLAAAFTAQVRTTYTTAEGLPDNDVSAVAVGADGKVYAKTRQGAARLEGSRWVVVEAFPEAPGEAAAAGVPDRPARQVAVGPRGEAAVAAANGLYRREGSGEWRAMYPREGGRSWAPHDVRGVAFDTRGRLWFASPQGVGCWDGRWRLYTGYEGLPYDDFTTVAAGEDGVVWLGTRRGAIRYDGKTWEYRQGRRWLPDDEVRGIAVTREGHAWFATAKGVGVIERRPMTLEAKAKFFEDEIDRRHRRTPYGYVLSVSLKRPGETGEWTQHDSDNDGLWTGMYGAGECFAYAATKDPAAKRRARAAFEALRFLGTVTQGGERPAPPGFVARSILSTSGPDPNATYTRRRDEERRATRDRLWKVLSPRWPRSADGKWYWKSDTSSDELDGHYFLYAQYYDLVAETEAEKEDVRRVVRGITDHLLAHDYALVDWDGTPTRWAVFGPQAINQGIHWWVERGLNSLSILSYLKTAEHLTGEAKYRRAYEELITKHHYATNLMVPKVAEEGIGTGNQSDDEMAFMSFYNLVRYEKDAARRQQYCVSWWRYWQEERRELNPLFNFLYAAGCQGEKFTDAFRTLDLTPAGEWLAESRDTLERYPLDRVDWRQANSHRKDLVLLPGGAGRGARRDGRVLPIDERFVEYWNHDPFRLDQGGEGRQLADGASFLLPYYLGLYQRFVE